MAIRLYLDEDVDPLLAQVLRDRGMDCLSTLEANNRGLPDPDQLTFATAQGRAILTFNVKDFVDLSREYARFSRHHGGIIVSNHLPFRELLRRMLLLLERHSHGDLTDKLLWLHDYKRSNIR